MREFKTLTDWNVTQVKDSKQAEIEIGLSEIQKMENDIIKLAETRSKRLIIGAPCQEIDNEISKLLYNQRDKTRTNLYLQKIWVNRDKTRQYKPIK